MLIYLTEDNIIVIQRAFLGHSALRDPSLLSAAVVRPRQRALYVPADLATHVAVLIEAIAQAHAFVDANKRTATAAGLIFSQINGYRCQYTGDAVRDELGMMVVALVAHQMSQEDIAGWLRTHCSARASVQAFDPILQQVLRDFAPTFRFLQDK